MSRRKADDPVVLVQEALHPTQLLVLEQLGSGPTAEEPLPVARDNADIHLPIRVHIADKHPTPCPLTQLRHRTTLTAFVLSFRTRKLLSDHKPCPQRSNPNTEAIHGVNIVIIF